MFVIFLCRFFFSVLINYTFPYKEWVDGEFVLKDSKSARSFYPSYDFPSLWGKWDTTYYVVIADKGYESGPFTTLEYKNWGFFPLYPLLIKGLVAIMGVVGFEANVNLYLIAGLLISNVCFAFALYFLDEVLEMLGFNSSQKALSLFMFLTFPSNYFYSLVYSESLFLLLCCLLLYFMFRNKPVYAAIALGFLLVSRPTGLAFVPVFFIWLWLNRKQAHAVRHILSYIFVFAPLAIFLLYMKGLTGEYLAPFTIQQAWNNSYQVLGVFVNYIRMYGWSIKYEFVLSVIMLLIAFGATIWGSVRTKYLPDVQKQNIKLLLLGTAGFLFIISGVTSISSLFRYLGACISLFIVIPAFLDPAKYKYVYVFSMFTGLILQSLFFIYFLTNAPIYGF